MGRSAIQRDPATGCAIAAVIAVGFGRLAVRCPFCKRKHWHGMRGQHDTDTDFGHRVSRCETGGSYLVRRTHPGGTMKYRRVQSGAAGHLTLRRDWQGPNYFERLKEQARQREQSRGQTLRARARGEGKAQAQAGATASQNELGRARRGRWGRVGSSTAGGATGGASGGRH